MPSIFDKIYDKFISSISGIRERFGLSRRPEREREPITPVERDEVPTFEVPDFMTTTEERVFVPWSSIAFYDPNINRFRDARTGLILAGDEYRAAQQVWREEFLDEIIRSRFSILNPEERQRLIDIIEDIRMSDAAPEDKDDAIRTLLGS